MTTHITKSDNGTATLYGNDRCFKASKHATETCDRYVCCIARDRRGNNRWGIIAHHGPFEQLFQKTNPKADPRNRICCWLSNDAAAAMDVLTNYIPSGDEAYKLDVPYGYFALWSCNYDPATGDWSVYIYNDRRGIVSDKIVAKANAAINSHKN